MRVPALGEGRLRFRLVSCSANGPIVADSTPLRQRIDREFSRKTAVLRVTTDIPTTTPLAVCLAKHVLRGLLPLTHAEAALAVAIIRQERAGTSLGSGTFNEKMRIARHIIRLNIETQENERHQAGVTAP
jgi:hypothetical protein